MRRLVAALALATGLGSAASAAIINTSPVQRLTATAFTITPGGGTGSFAFTSAATGNGPGAAISTGGTALVSSFFGSVTDFFAGAKIDQRGELYGFSAFTAPATIPFSAADDFVGLAFTLSDGLHYGYAEVAGSELVSYGYETVAGRTILTAAVPEPASLALLLVALTGAITAKRRVRR